MGARESSQRGAEVVEEEAGGGELAVAASGQPAARFGSQGHHVSQATRKPRARARPSSPSATRIRAPTSQPPKFNRRLVQPPDLAPTTEPRGPVTGTDSQPRRMSA